MKGLFGLVGLLLALAIVGVVVKKQLSSLQQPVPALAPSVPAGAAAGATPPPANVREQSQQMQQQFKQAVEGAMQQPRPLPGDQ
jgi:hypothetical protein